MRARKRAKTSARDLYEIEDSDAEEDKQTGHKYDVSNMRAALCTMLRGDLRHAFNFQGLTITCASDRSFIVQSIAGCGQFPV